MNKDILLLMVEELRVITVQALEQLEDGERGTIPGVHEDLAANNAAGYIEGALIQFADKWDIGGNVSK